MTNKEKYQRTFGVLHASDAFLTGGYAMKTRHFSGKRALALCAVMLLILAMGMVCYAEDIGGIQRTLQIWIHGDQTDAVLDIQDGSYTMTYEDETGTHEISGGGVAIGPFGQERPLTEEEIMEHLRTGQVEVEEKEDGTTWVYYKEQILEITDLFDSNGVCFVQLRDGKEVLYLTVKKGNGYSLSTKGFVQPDKFNF